MRKFWTLFALIVLPICSQKVCSQTVDGLTEFSTNVHLGDNNPLWQVSNRHGLSSLENNAYVRGVTHYKTKMGALKLQSALDLVFATGFTSNFVIQQAYLDLYYQKLGLSFGSKERNSPLLNQQLSSGGLTWSGNACPIPQLYVGIVDFINITDWFRGKADLSFGVFTDNGYQKRQVASTQAYTKDILYHHKSFAFQLGKADQPWKLDAMMQTDVQFGGTIHHPDGHLERLGSSFSDFMHVLIPQGGTDSGPEGEQFYQGNSLGSEIIKLSYQKEGHQFSAYMENFFDDFSGMGKLNGFDGLWGVEYVAPKKGLINGFVLEYYQTTNQSGPLHGIPSVGLTGGADDYYNNDWYPGWVHWGMSIANPLIASPIYDKEGYMRFKYNRIKAIHVGWSGDLSSTVSYRTKISYNQTWGTPFIPVIQTKENASFFTELTYRPQKQANWTVLFSLAADMGDIYGNNAGAQLTLKRTF